MIPQTLKYSPMKKIVFVCFLVVLTLNGFLAFKLYEKKENIYIRLDDDIRYSYEYFNREKIAIKSTQVDLVDHIIIKEKDSSHHRWEINIINSEVKKGENNSIFYNQIISSCDFIKYNGRKKGLRNYKLYLFEPKGDDIYIYPVEHIVYALE